MVVKSYLKNSEKIIEPFTQLGARSSPSSGNKFAIAQDRWKNLWCYQQA